MSSLPPNNYSCPSCGGNLELSATTSACLKCQHSFPLTNGVIDFRVDPMKDHNYPLSREDMERLNRQFSSHSWKEILGNFLECTEDAPRWLDELVDDGRYAWKIFLNLGSGMTLLNASGNLGTTTANLAPHFERVYTLNPSYQNAVFTRKRLDLSSSKESVSVLVAQEDGRLPLISGCVDIAIFDGILDGSSKGGEQLAVLQELSRVTSQDGSLFIRCGNRLNYKQIDSIFSEAAEGNTSRSITRTLANLLRQVKNRIRTKNHRHTIYGYRKLLKSAGFHHVEFVTFHPDDNQSEEVRPGPGNFPLWTPLSASGWKDRIKQSPWFAPGFGIIAQKRKLEIPRLEDSISEKLVQKLGKRLDQFHTQHYLASSKGKLIVKTVCDGDFIYVRLPLNEHAHSAERQNHARLEWLQSHRADLSEFFPHPLLKGCENGQHFFAESAVLGTSILNVVKAQRNAKESLTMGLDFLVALNYSHLDTGASLKKNDFDRFVSTPLASLSTFISDLEMRSLEGFFQDRLLERKIPRGLLHGDYSAQNILTRDGRVTGLLDWEESVTNGIPALDAVCLTLSCLRRLERNVEASKSLVDLARRKAYLGNYIESIEAYYDRTDTDPECHEALVLLYWISAIYHRVGLGRSLANTSDEEFIKKVIAQVLDVSKSTSSRVFSS